MKCMDEDIDGNHLCLSRFLMWKISVKAFERIHCSAGDEIFFGEALVILLPFYLPGAAVRRAGKMGSFVFPGGF